ncbi:hypothetical protein M0R45_037828 [Rubus argutus]|uniref:Uncharacterized protein n=1 Tax=Rubus argutus TaxID=59490 RepID=A0AAW1W402_RUBAR
MPPAFRKVRHDLMLQRCCDWELHGGEESSSCHFGRTGRREGKAATVVRKTRAVVVAKVMRSCTGRPGLGRGARAGFLAVLSATENGPGQAPYF